MMVTLHPAEQYVRDVLDGDIVTGLLVRQACERHVRDLERIGTPGWEYWFDRESAQDAIDFFALCKHSKGKEWRGKPIELQPWQQFVVWNVFGWRRADGSRRFRYVYEEQARKQGKSTKVAGIALKLTGFDGEGGAEVYAAATKRKQAKIVFGEAQRMIKASPDLSAMFEVFAESIVFPFQESKFEPLGADTGGEHGLNVHGAIIDEVHAHKSRELIDILDTGTASRTNWLIWMITTAGTHPSGPAWDYRRHSEAVLGGSVKDEEFFAYIASLDPEDEWKEERNWIKANPNLGVSVSLDYLRAKFNRSQDSPVLVQAFRQLHLNQWVGSSKADISMDAWKRCGGPIDIEKLRSRPCCAGLDMAAQFDLNAFCLCWPATRADPYWYYLWWFWAPEARERKRERLTRLTYDGWAKQGFIKITEGDVADYNVIQADIEDICRTYKVQEIGFDPYNATQLEQNLTKNGHKMILIRQGFGTLHAPTKMLDSNVVAGTVRHGDNPVAAWMASNVVYRRDTINGSMMPHKEKSAGKIDGIAAAVMATGRAMVMPEPINLDDYVVNWV